MFRFRSSFIAAAMVTLGAIVSPGTLPVAAQQLDQPALSDDQTVDLGSCSTNRPPAPAAAPRRSADPVTLKGSGKTQTRPFTLADGAYTVTWELGQSSEYASYSVRLVPVVDEPFHHAQTIMSAVYTKNPDASGDTHIYDIKAGKYYLAVEAPKGWRVTFTPLPL